MGIEMGIESAMAIVMLVCDCDLDFWLIFVLEFRFRFLFLFFFVGDSISGELERIEEENMNLVNQIKDLQEDLINTREELDSFKNNAR